MNDRDRDDVAEAVRQLARTQSAQPVRFTAEMLLMKADLARLDARATTVRRIERWAFGIVGAVLAAIVFVANGHADYSVASLALAAITLTLAECWFACAIEA